jgi:hypothetical protein
MYILKSTVNSIFREYAAEYINKYKPGDYEIKIIRAIIDCRTEALGGHIQKCDQCGDKITLYNSCRNRHCPQCQFMKKEQWILDRKEEVLPYQYFHVVFTLPDKLNPIVYRNKKIIYKLLFDKTKETLISVSRDEKYFGAKIGFFSILHTWGQKLNLHPHVHCVVPGGGYREDKDKWVRAPAGYLIPYEVLKQRFRSIFLVGLKQLHKEGRLYLWNTEYTDKKIFQQLIDELFKTEWIVYIKESFNNSDSVIEYLAKYTHRIAISNHRIISLENGVVTFSYKDYADGNKKKRMSLSVMQFMRCFLLHVVPYKFVRIRYYGILSNSIKRRQLEKCREYYRIRGSVKIKKEWFEIYRIVTGIDIFECKKCHKGRMIMYETIKAVNKRDGP